MPDIRLARRRTSQLWLWTGILAAVGFLVWASAFVFGDPTDPADQPRVGAAADFGAQRAPVLPIESVPFTALDPLDPRDLGRLIQLRGAVESRIVQGNFWVRAEDGRRILARVEPLPGGDLPGVRPGGSIDVQGYLQNISRAEFFAWMDSLNVAIPRPPPAARFGQLPDPAFAHLEVQFIRDYYVSIRPRQLTGDSNPQSE
jgi:hypothetical protein